MGHNYNNNYRCSHLYNMLNFGCSFPSSLIQYNTILSDSKWLDKIGHEERQVRQGRSYTFNGTDNYIDFGIINANAGVLYYAPSSTTPILDSLNANGELFNGVSIEIVKYAVLINGAFREFNCEEENGTISYSTTNGITGTINGTLTSFHTINNDQKESVANNRGYGQDNGSNVIIPISKDTTSPVIATDNVYSDRVKYNLMKL